MSRASLLLCLLMLGCADGDAVTEIVAVVDGDLSVPEELDALELTVEGVTDPITARADLTQEGLPRRVAIVHGGGPLGPITIMVKGFLGGGDPVVTRSVRTFFEAHARVEVQLLLESACQGVVCGRGETCDDGSCDPIDAMGMGTPSLEDAQTPPEAMDDGGTEDPEGGGLLRHDPVRG